MQSSAHIWLAERCALKGPGSLQVPLQTFSKTSSLYPARQSPGLLQAPSGAQLPLQLQALPYACMHVSLQPPLPCSLGHPAH